MGTIAFCSYIPVLLLGPVAGVAADRYRRSRSVLATQIAFSVQPGALAALTLSVRNPSTGPTDR
jgi:MFS family permease